MTHDIPSWMLSGGCSARSITGMTHETDGRWPDRAPRKNSVFGRISLSCPVACTGLEPRQWVLHRGGLDPFELLARRGDARPVTDVVRPADAVRVEHPRDVPPDVRAWSAVRGDPLLARMRPHAAGELLIGVTAHGVVQVGARRRPPGQQEQVRGERPRVGGREHAVVERVRLRVVPIVRDLLGRVVAHDVGLPCGAVVRGRARVLTRVVHATVARSRGAPGRSRSSSRR